MPYALNLTLGLKDTRPEVNPGLSFENIVTEPAYTLRCQGTLDNTSEKLCELIKLNYDITIYVWYYMIRVQLLVENMPTM